MLEKDDDAAAAAGQPTELPPAEPPSSLQATPPIRIIPSSTNCSSLGSNSRGNIHTSASVASPSGDREEESKPAAALSPFLTSSPLSSLLQSHAAKMQQQPEAVQKEGPHAADAGLEGGRQRHSLGLGVRGGGGAPILLSVAGREAGAEFRRHHPWVNYSFILENCRVGILERRSSVQTLQSALLPPPFPVPSGLPSKTIRDPLRLALNQGKEERRIPEEQGEDA
ncbi:hypothetical protein Emag_002740 [Eimeria magna]